MSVFRAPTLVHEAAARSIKDQIDKMIWAKVQDDKFQGFINAAVLPLEDTAEFTTKVPDYLLGYQPEDAPEVRPLFIAEVGYSETYQDLVKAMKSWIQGMDHVKQALLVKFTETPKYSTSRILEQLPQNVVDNAKRYATDRSLLSMDVHEGKLEINGCSFVGRTTAFVEKWTRDADSGKAVVGDRIVSTLQFLLFGFFPLSVTANVLDYLLTYEGCSISTIRQSRLNRWWNKYLKNLS